MLLVPYFQRTFIRKNDRAVTFMHAAQAGGITKSLKKLARLSTSMSAWANADIVCRAKSIPVSI